MPVVTLPKLRLVGFDVIDPGETAVPDKGTVKVGLVAFEEIVTVPLGLPVVWGAKVTVNVFVCDAFRVSGVVMPLSWNPVPLIEACEITTLVPPVFVSVTV